ncbi:hypothetical protein BDZ45DRAFT_745972 [Acephala macrosclerotiorum]|nr:hypothetical protein BDZ45DRAFT_745972 [Acephala macrosclerotiorum]
MQSQIDKIASLDLESEPNVRNIAEVDQPVKYSNNPAARDAIVTAVQEVTRPKPLPTPAPTPCNSNTPGEQTPTPLASQHVTQEEPDYDNQTPTPLASQHVVREGSFDCNDPTEQHKNSSGKHHDENLPAAQHELEQRSRPSKDTYVEAADDSESEQSVGSQHSASLDGWPPADHGNDLHDQDARPNDQPSEQTATSLTQNESNISQYPSRKRKHNLERGRDSKRPHIEAADATEVELGSRSLQFSRSLELLLETDQDERHDQQPEISEARKDGRLSIAAATLPTPPQTVIRSRRPSPVPPDVDLSNGESDKFTRLSAALRAKLGRIADTATLATVWNYLNYKRTPLSSADDCVESSKQDSSPGIISASDQRLRELKNRIVRDEKKKKFVNHRRIVVRISKRVALAELIGKYIEERNAKRAVPKKRRKKQLPQSSPKDRFTDLLFPDTVKYKGEKLDEKTKSMQVIEEKGPRENAKKKLDYWIVLEEPLARMAQRYGIAIVPLLPEKLTNKNLHGLPRPQIPLFLDYIDLIRPGLKEQVCNLSTVLPQIVDNRLPPRKLVLETLTSNLLPQLRSSSLEELFKFDTDVTDSRQADAAVGSSSDQGRANEQSYVQVTSESLQSRSPSADFENRNPQVSHAQSTIESVQDSRPDCTSESIRPRPPSAEIEDGNPSNPTTDYSKFAHPSTCHEKSDYYQELDQEFSSFMENPSCFKDDDKSAQLQPEHSRGFLNPQDYYSQDDDWRAQRPSANEREFLDSQDSDLQRSSLSDTEFSDLDSFIDYSPKNTSSLAFTCLNQSRGQNLPARFVDMSRASTNCIIAWTAHNQDTGIINPKDLFQASV